MSDDYRECGMGSVFLAFVLGAAIGGGVALLTAPRSGRETREKIREATDDARDRLREVADETETRVKKVIAEGRDLLDEKKDLIKSAVAAGKEAIEAEKASHKKPA